MTSSTTGELNLGHIFAAAGVDASDVVVLRHTYKPDGLTSEAALTPEKILDYTSRQGRNNKLGKKPPFIWVVLLADGGLRSRLLAVYENHDEVLSERTATRRRFDLRPSPALAALVGRLVVQWSGDPVNWVKLGPVASAFPVVEIADPQAVAFPGFDNVLLTHAELQAMLEDSRYAAWRTPPSVPCKGSTSSLTPAPASSMWARPTAARTSSGAGRLTPGTATAATSLCGTLPVSTPATPALPVQHPARFGP